ncbi:hypothetical protein VTN77DRAFT_1134 [Rasamsonia byssochlamydoides]|uniref:uncharacterized protein n=1 Tax=Rasamsonia byssochlamydoides TaxID=89139 RepID=UPI0037426EE9
MEDRSTAVMVVTIIFFVLASVFVALRFISRWGIVRRIALHDHVMLLAWIIDFGFTFSICYATTKGLGLPNVDVPPSWQSALNRWEYATTVLYNPALMALKTSILIFYLTLTKGEKVFRWANYVTLFVVNAAGFALTMLNVFQCRPLSAVFRYPFLGSASCIDIVTLYLSSAPVNLITDIAIFFLPMPILTRMRLPLKQKIILIITFSFGVFTAVVDVFRVAYLQSAASSRAMAYQSPDSSHVDTLEHQDFSWYGAFTFMWSAVEVNIGIICACVPSLKPLVARVLPRMIKGTDDLTPQAQTDHPTAEMPVNLPPSGSGPRSTTLRPPDSSSNPSDRPKTSHGGSEDGATGSAVPEDYFELMDFLTAPDAGNRDLEDSAPTGSSSTPQNITTFFDFVNVKKPKSMLKMNNRESIPPVALTTILFFLWGFAYGFLDILNSQFQTVAHVNTWGSLGMHAAYYGGYLVAPLTVGRLVLTTWGFKATFITGLCIYACGTLIFWPSAVLTSFPAYTISNFIVGFGLAVLETAANPFIALCGPLENSEVRLNFSQAIQATGSVLSPLLAKKVLFRTVQDAASLVDVQWTYLAIALFDILLAVAFYYLPVPEASDDDLKELADRRGDANSAKVAGVPVIWVTFCLGVFSQWCYVGGQEGLSTSFQNLVQALVPNSQLGSFDYLLIGRTLFAVGRFFAAFAQWFLKPRWILLVSYIGMIVFAVLCMDVDGTGGIAMGLMLFLFESGVFSIIFAISLRGLGPYTKTGASIMTAATSGGALWPFPQRAALNSRGTPYSFCVLVALFSAGAIFPVYLNLVPAARKQVDPVPNEYLRRHYPRRRRHHNQQPQQQQPVGVIHREKENPSWGGVLSRPRSLMDEPFPAVQLPEEVRLHDRAMSGSSSPSTLPVGRGGGIMHDLAPWPDE